MMPPMKTALAAAVIVFAAGQDGLKQLAGEVDALKKDVATLGEKIDLMSKSVAGVKAVVCSRTDRATRTECAERLSALITAMYDASVKGALPEDAGGKAWVLKVRVKDLGLFACPTAEPPGEGKTSYRGYNPKLGPLNAAPPDTIVMCDDPANHPDGVNVVLKDGSVRWAAKGSALYTRALGQTTE